MSYLFGKFEPEHKLDAAAASGLITRARAQTESFRAMPLARILDAIGRIGALWSPGSRYYHEARELLSRDLPFSRSMIEFSLGLIPQLCDANACGLRVDAELGSRARLDGFETRAGGARLRALPHGVLLHVSAGNVFLGCIDSLINGFLTKNVSIVKLSSRNQGFPLLFARSIAEADAEGVLRDKFALVHWTGGTRDVEAVFKTQTDAIIAWGGAEMTRAYRDGLGEGVTLIEHGPKISFQVVLREEFERSDAAELGRRLARDIALWDQAACASPQNLFFEKGLPVEELMGTLGQALENVKLERGKLSDDEEVEVLKEKYRARLTSLVEGGKCLEGHGWLLHYDPHPGLRASALNRTLILKRFDSLDDLASQLAPQARLLQSCSYVASGSRRDALLEKLAAVGVQRFAPAGTVMDGMIGAPHDGRFQLGELVRLVGDETRSNVLELVNEAIVRVPFYRALYEAKPVRCASELKPVRGADLPTVDPASLADLGDGYIFSSGGTSGKPKYSCFTGKDFERVGAMLARGYRAQGLRRGDLCANLFVAGNLWSSFMAVDRALSQLGAVQLPIGGLAEPELVLSYLARFRPRAVFGLPSLLVALAQATLEHALEVRVPVVCYAGEHLNAQGRALLKRAWGTERCFSAGYASVDAGPIGYQCPACSDREHHLFADQVHLEVLEGEAVVTSLAREAFPIIHLRTGDHVEWSEPRDARCGCGSTDPKFVLHGRCDGQINLWSCRLQQAELEAGLGSAGVTEPLYQVTIEDDELSIAVEGERFEAERLERVRASLYEHCRDLRQTHPFEFVRSRLFVRGVERGSLERVARTGKIRAVVDRRKL